MSRYPYYVCFDQLEEVSTTDRRMKTGKVIAGCGTCYSRLPQFIRSRRELSRTSLTSLYSFLINFKLYVIIAMAEWAHYSLPNAEWSQALDAIGGSLYKVNVFYDIPLRRETFNGFGRREVEAADKSTCKFQVTLCTCVDVNIRMPTVNGITVEERRIPVTKPKGEIPIRIYTPNPDKEGETFPALVNIHGTLFSTCTHDPHNSTLLIQSISSQQEADTL